MSSSYPGGLDTLATNKADSTATATDHAQHHNDLADAVNKIEAELGTTPKGTYSSVKARLDSVNHRIYPAGLMVPVALGSHIIPTTVLAPTLNVLWGCRFVVPLTGSLRHVSWWIGASSGHVTAAVYDTGDAAGGGVGTRTKLWDSGSLVAGGANAWQTADPGAGVIPVTRGQHVDIMLVADNTTVTLGRSLIAVNSGANQLPGPFATVPGGALPKVCFTHSPGSYTAPATITEANVSVAGSTPVILATVI